jgi:hypothetical protein
MLEKPRSASPHASTTKRDRLLFEGNGAAFQYACSFEDCSLVPEQHIIGLVLNVTCLDGMPCFLAVKMRGLLVFALFVLTISRR